MACKSCEFDRLLDDFQSQAKRAYGGYTPYLTPVREFDELKEIKREIKKMYREAAMPPKSWTPRP